MGRIEADIALESWLFGFQPCSGQGQFTLPFIWFIILGLQHDSSRFRCLLMRFTVSRCILACHCEMTDRWYAVRRLCPHGILLPYD